MEKKKKKSFYFLVIDIDFVSDKWLLPDNKWPRLRKFYWFDMSFGKWKCRTCQNIKQKKSILRRRKCQCVKCCVDLLFPCSYENLYLGQNLTVRKINN